MDGNWVLSGLSTLYLCAVGIFCVAHAMLWYALRKRPSGPSNRESVTVLKPFCGLDGQVSHTLEPLCVQTHPATRVVVGVASCLDPALPVLERFRARHRGQVELRIGERGAFINPKVALLDHMAEGVATEWLVISDSNVRLTSSYVSAALDGVGPDVGLVTHLVSGRGGRGVAAELENLQLNAFVAPAVCAARFMANRTCVIGKSMFLRRSALRALGGLRQVSSYLAEDYALGQAVEAAGYRVATAATPIVAWHEDWTLRRFINRHTRWAVMRRRVSLTGYAIELLLNPGPLAAPLWWSGWLLGHWVLAPQWLLGTFALRGAVLSISQRLMGGAWPRPAVLAWNAAREWLALWLWLRGWYVRCINWRGKLYRVGAGSSLSPVLPRTEGYGEHNAFHTNSALLPEGANGTRAQVTRVRG